MVHIIVREHSCCQGCSSLLRNLIIVKYYSGWFLSDHWGPGGQLTNLSEWYYVFLGFAGDHLGWWSPRNEDKENAFLLEEKFAISAQWEWLNKSTVRIILCEPWLVHWLIELDTLLPCSAKAILPALICFGEIWLWNHVPNKYLKAL